MITARILSIYANGETSSILGRFDNESAVKERARNEIEMPGRGTEPAVAVLVLTTDPLAHYEAVIANCEVCGAPSLNHLNTCTRRNQRVRYKAEKAIGFKERS